MRPRPFAAEHPLPTAARETVFAASMRPRPFAAEHGSFIVIDPATKKSFNEAAAFRRGTHYTPIYWLLEKFLLQ